MIHIFYSGGYGEYARFGGLTSQVGQGVRVELQQYCLYNIQNGMGFVEWFRNTFDGWLKGRYNTKLPQDFVIVAVNIVLVEYEDSL